LVTRSKNPNQNDANFEKTLLYFVENFVRDIIKILKGK
jgi:hypothetical protein